jgi:hypothetical protein
VATTLVAILVLNETDSKGGHAKPVFYVTLPAAVLLFCWDLASNWQNRHHTRQIAREGKQAFEEAREQRRASYAAPPASETASVEHVEDVPSPSDPLPNRETAQEQITDTMSRHVVAAASPSIESPPRNSGESPSSPSPAEQTDEKPRARAVRIAEGPKQKSEPTTLVSLCESGYKWAQETFPTVMAVVAHLPFALIPFGLCMFVLVQGLASRGWINVFAYGW